MQFNVNMLLNLFRLIAAKFSIDLTGRVIFWSLGSRLAPPLFTARGRQREQYLRMLAVGPDRLIDPLLYFVTDSSDVVEPMSGCGL